MTEEVKKQIVIHSRRLGKSLKELSRAMDKNDAYLQQFVNYGTPKELGEADRLVLAKELEIDEELLMSAELRKARKKPLTSGSENGGPQLPGDNKEAAVRKVLAVLKDLESIYTVEEIRQAALRYLTADRRESENPRQGLKTS